MLKATGIIRMVDELGRVVIPIELRRTMKIDEADSLEIFTDNKSVILKKYEPGCIFCGSTVEIIDIKGKNVCKACIKEIVEER